MSLIANIGHLRSAKGLTQKKLAKLLRVSPNTLSSWENDESKTKKLYVFFKLCEALGCEHSAFLEIDQRPFEDRSGTLSPLRIEAIRQKIHTQSDIVSPIAQLRKQKRLSQEALAEIVDVTPNTIQNWERDRSGRNRHGMIARLCELLGCTYKDLVRQLPDSKAEDTATNNYPADIPKSYQ